VTKGEAAKMGGEIGQQELPRLSYAATKSKPKKPNETFGGNPFGWHRSLGNVSPTAIPYALVTKLF
jgi:hypothetical protein